DRPAPRRSGTAAASAARPAKLGPNGRRHRPARCRTTTQERRRRPGRWPRSRRGPRATGRKGFRSRRRLLAALAEEGARQGPIIEQRDEDRSLSPAVVLAAALLAVPATMSVLQDRLLYFPDRAPIEQTTPPGLRPWPSTELFRGFVAEPAGAARATAIVFLGNAGHAGHRAFSAQWLVPLGL